MLRRRLMLSPTPLAIAQNGDLHKGNLYQKASTESFEDFAKTWETVDDDVTLDAILEKGWKYVCVMGSVNETFTLMSDEPMYIVVYKNNNRLMVVHGHRAVKRTRKGSETNLSLSTIPALNYGTWTFEDFDVEDYKIETWGAPNPIDWCNFDVHIWADTLEQGKTSLVAFDKNLDNPNMDNKGFTRYYFKDANNQYTYCNYPFYAIKNDDGTYQLCIGAGSGSRYHCGNLWDIRVDYGFTLSGRDGDYKVENVKRTQAEMDAIISNAPIYLWEYDVKINEPLSYVITPNYLIYGDNGVYIKADSNRAFLSSTEETSLNFTKGDETIYAFKVSPDINRITIKQNGARIGLLCYNSARKIVYDSGFKSGDNTYPISSNLDKSDLYFTLNCEHNGDNLKDVKIYLT